jgi:putative heme-binding domain-containing protein
MVREALLPRLARRYAVEGKRQQLLAGAKLFELAPSERAAAALLKGLEEAFRGRSMSGLPDELLAGLRKAGRLPLPFRLRQGEREAVAEAIGRIADAKAPLDERLLLVRAFGELHEPGAVPVLLQAAAGPAPDELRRAALASLSGYDGDAVGSRVSELLPALAGDARTAAFALLSSRPAWSARLLDAVEAGRVKPAEVPDDVATRLRSGEDAAVAARAGRLLRPPVAVPAEVQKRIDEVTATLKGGPGNPYAGEPIFMERCAKCHTLFFKGGKVGPDLTAYQRDNLPTMLLSIVNPNAEIREGFQYYLVATTDGRVLSGFFTDRDHRVSVLRTIEGENVTLRAEQIRAVKPAGLSLMPAGLLDGLDERQLRDLFAYLRITQPITK